MWNSEKKCQIYSRSALITSFKSWSMLNVSESSTRHHFTQRLWFSTEVLILAFLPKRRMFKLSLYFVLFSNFQKNAETWFLSECTNKKWVSSTIKIIFRFDMVTLLGSNCIRTFEQLFCLLGKIPLLQKVKETTKWGGWTDCQISVLNYLFRSMVAIMDEYNQQL